MSAGEFGLVFCYIGMSVFGGLAAAYLVLLPQAKDARDE